MSEYNPLYLVKVEAGANNNKYYRMLPRENNFLVEYGRIGVDGFQTCTYSLSQWSKKLNEKLRKGYVDQSRLVAEPTIIQKKKEYLDIENPSIAQIISRLQSMAKQAIKDNYTISSNKVTQIMIDEAQVTLNNLINTDNIEKFNQILIELFKIIPRKMGRVADYLVTKKTNFADIIQREQDLLDVMKGQVIQHSVIDEEEIDTYELPKQTILDVLGLQFGEITSEEKEIIKKNLGSIGDKYYQAWKVTNNKTQKKFDDFVKSNSINNIKLLWHGSRNENFWSIINLGLMLKPTNAIRTGSMFGNGIYFSNDAGKSFNYTSYAGSYWAKGNANTAFMILNDIAYGNPYNVYSFDSKYYNFDYEKLQQACKGASSLHAHGGTGMLRRDEIIVYKENQVTIKYLVELR